MSSQDSRLMSDTNARNRDTFQPKVQLVQIRGNSSIAGGPGLFLAACGVADRLVVPALVRKEREGKQAATKKHREKDAQDSGDYQVEI